VCLSMSWSSASETNTITESGSVPVFIRFINLLRTEVYFRHQN
jgi:hypothetical protein